MNFQFRYGIPTDVIFTLIHMMKERKEKKIAVIALISKKMDLQKILKWNGVVIGVIESWLMFYPVINIDFNYQL